MDEIVVSFENFERLYQKIKEQELEEIRFELIIGSLFPNIYDNIKQEMKRQHALGYMDGLAEGKSVKETSE